MRQIVLDTETTGLEPAQGDRIVEIACVEIAERRLTGRTFQTYLDPQRPVSAGALRVHGLTDEFLRGKPSFADAAPAFLAFIGDAELIIHNAAFDTGFLDMELARAGLPALRAHIRGTIDTLALAREQAPNRRASLDALCERYAVDASTRTLHGALLDASLLAAVYLAMTRGQGALEIGAEEIDLPPVPSSAVARFAPVPVIAANAAECDEHARLLQGIAQETKRACVWTSA